MRLAFWKQWLIQFAGVTLLALVVWAFLNTPDQRPWQIGLSGLLVVAAILTATWVAAENLFHGRAPLLRAFGCLLLILGLLWLLGRVEGKTWQMATWIASAVSWKSKKAVSPEQIVRLLGWIFWVCRWLPIPLFALWAGFRRERYGRIAGAYILCFLAGAVLPHYLIHWVPAIQGFWPQVASAAARFLAAYILAISAWVALGRVTSASANRSLPN